MSVTQPLRASEGQIRFREDINPDLRHTITDIWVHRIAGFNSLNLKQYLRDFAIDAQIVINGKSFTCTLASYRRRIRYLFFGLRLRSWLKIPRIQGEVLDAVVTKSESGYVTNFIFMVLAGDRIQKQFRCTQTIKEDENSLKFHLFTMDRIPQDQWPIKQNKTDDGNPIVVHSESVPQM